MIVGDRVRVTERLADELLRAGCAAHYVDELRRGGTIIKIHGPSKYAWRKNERTQVHFDDPQDLEVIE